MTFVFDATNVGHKKYLYKLCQSQKSARDQKSLGEMIEALKGCIVSISERFLEALIQLWQPHSGGIFFCCRFLCAMAPIIVDERLWIKIGMKINEENEMMNNDERKNVGSIQSGHPMLIELR